MDKRSQVMKLAGAALLTLAALQMSAFDAFAAKETFVRSKPHVNVGTIGPATSQTGAGGMTSTPEQPSDNITADCEPDPSKTGEASRPPCAPADAD
jgi:hypothetical protein